MTSRPALLDPLLRVRSRPKNKTKVNYNGVLCYTDATIIVIIIIIIAYYQCKAQKFRENELELDR